MLPLRTRVELVGVLLFFCLLRNTLHDITVIGAGTLSFLVTIIWRLEVQSWMQANSNMGIFNTCIRLWLTESEQATPVDYIKDVVRSSVLAPEFDKKHLKKTGGHIGRNVGNITIKIKTIDRKPWLMKIFMVYWLMFWLNNIIYNEIKRNKINDKSDEELLYNVMIIFVWNGHNEPSSNPRQVTLLFNEC